MLPSTNDPIWLVMLWARGRSQMEAQAAQPIDQIDRWVATRPSSEFDCFDCADPANSHNTTREGEAALC